MRKKAAANPPPPSHRLINFAKIWSELVLTLSGPGGGGGGGLRGPDDQTHRCQSETTYSMMHKHGDF